MSGFICYRKGGIQLIAVDTLEQAKQLPCVFNNWAVFDHGVYKTNHLLNETFLKKKFQ
ncbi:MAG: YoaP domain-containing protein [Peptococcaceae bacterium]